jgi:hypothetical protein
LSIALLATADVSAQNQRYYPQQPQYSQPPPSYQQPPPGYGAPSYGYPQQPQKQYENPIEFLPKFGKRMSEVVRRIFYGQDPTGWDSPPPGNGPNGAYSLDSTPRQQPAPGYPQQPPSGYYQPQQPGYQYPPQQGRASSPNQAPRTQQTVPQNKITSPNSSSQNKSGTRTYSPPKVGSSEPKTQSKPSTVTPPKEPVKETAPPPPTTTRRSESTPPRESPSTTASSGSGSFLKGRKTAKAGRVISPYPPYKELDVTGLESGSLALDPTTQKVFEVP